jgi:hypothetical protein
MIPRALAMASGENIHIQTPGRLKCAPHWLVLMMMQEIVDFLERSMVNKHADEQTNMAVFLGNRKVSKECKGIALSCVGA